MWWVRFLALILVIVGLVTCWLWFMSGDYASAIFMGLLTAWCLHYAITGREFYIIDALITLFSKRR